MFDSFDDECDHNAEKIFNEHLGFNFESKRSSNQFMEFDDDDHQFEDNKTGCKNFEFFNLNTNDQFMCNRKKNGEKSVLESDNKLDLSNSNKDYFNDLAKNKLVLYLNRPFQILNYSNSSGTTSGKSLKQKLLELYLEESKRAKTYFSESKYLNYSTNLLEKLVNHEKYNTIVLNLYTQNEGYSFGFNIKTKNNYDEKNEVYNLNKIETKLLSYKETDIFFYINTGEIPPILIDLVDHLNINLYYDGCIVLEIRDHRRKFNTDINYDLNYVLLNPSMQTLLADINSITKSGNCVWTQEDKYALESQLLLATTQPLCLVPNPIVSIIKNKILSYKYRLSSRNIKKMCLRHSEACKLRALKWHEYKLPYPFRILKIRKKISNDNTLHFIQNDFINKKQNEISLHGLNHENSKFLLNLNENSVKYNQIHSSDINLMESAENWFKSRPIVDLPPVESILVKRFTKTNEPPKFTSEPNLIPIEELIMEAEDKTSKNNYSRLLILRQTNDGVYYCQLSLRSDQKSETSYRVGSASDVEKYIQQYVKIFTEEGRRQVTLKHNLIEKPIDNKPSTSYSTLKKPVNTSLVQTRVPFQHVFPSKNSNDKQLQLYQLFLQQEFEQQRNQLEQLRRSRSTSSDDTNPNLKSLITQNSVVNSTPVNNQNFTQTPPKTFATIQPIRPQVLNTPPVVQPTSNVITLNQKQDTGETLNNVVQYQKMGANQSVSTANNNVIQVLVPKLGSQSVNSSMPGKISPGTNQVQNVQNSQSILTNAVAETQPKTVTKKSPKNKTPITTTTTTTPKRQAKKRTNSAANTSQVNLAPKTSNDMNGDQNFKPTTSAKIINASNLNLFKKIAIDNRSVPVIVTLNSDSNKKSNDDSSPIKSTNTSSPIKTTTIQILQKSTPVISLNSAQNKIYNQEITNVTSVVSSPIKKTNQDYYKQSNEPIYLTSPTTAKSVQSRQNFILPTTVKTIPINSKTNQQFMTTNSLDNQSLFSKQLNNNQQATSVILLTNNTNTNIQKSNSIN